MKIFCVLLFSVFASLPVGATSPEQCPSLEEEFNITRLRRMYFKKSKSCGLLVNKITDETLYRSHHFSDQGLYMIFANFGWGEENEDVGAQAYWLFPRNGIPSYVIDTVQNELSIQMADIKVIFSTLTAEIIRSENIDIKVEPLNEKRDSAGITITSYQGTYFDNGFALGTVGYNHKDWSSKVYSPTSSCTLKNDELFNYIYGQTPNGTWYLDEVFLKHESDEQLDIFLTEKCN